MRNTTKIRFGLIGLGMMGREFAGAVGRWGHLSNPQEEPVITAICSQSAGSQAWFLDRFSTIKVATTDYQELLDSQEVDAVYCAVPHHLHHVMYPEIIRSGKALMGEKPFGIDLQANGIIMESLQQNPGAFVRCASEFSFFPGAQRVYEWASSGRLGTIIEGRVGFGHSSDLDITKPINWKRQKTTNGDYGCMGDLGIHIQHLPFRLGWTVDRVYGRFTKLVKERPDPKGGLAACDTWDNAVLLCDAQDEKGRVFPLLMETKRMDPGSTNRWYVEIDGMDASVKYSTEDPNAFYYLETRGKEQAWCRLDLGHQTLWPTATGSIFQFGFTDSILQMWATFIAELQGLPVPFGCFTAEETVQFHRIATAALESQASGQAVSVPQGE